MRRCFAYCLDPAKGENTVTESEKIEFLAGQLHALMGFATANICSDPRLEELAEGIEKVGEVNLARVEGDLVSDEYVEGVLHVRKHLRQSVEIARAQRKGPRERG